MTVLSGRLQTYPRVQLVHSTKEQAQYELELAPRLELLSLLVLVFLSWCRKLLNLLAWISGETLTDLPVSADTCAGGGVRTLSLSIVREWMNARIEFASVMYTKYSYDGQLGIVIRSQL